MSKAAVVTTRDSVGAFEALGFVGTVVEDGLQARTGGFGVGARMREQAGGAWAGLSRGVSRAGSGGVW